MRGYRGTVVALNMPAPQFFWAGAKKLGVRGRSANHSNALRPRCTCTRSADSRHTSEGRISLTVNAELRQDGDLNQMIWKVPEMIAYLSRYFTLAPGDVIMAGTPAGVGPVARGDVMEAAIDGLGTLTVTVT